MVGSRRVKALSLCGVVATAMIAACGSASTTGSTKSPTSTPAPTAVTVQFTYTWKAEYAPLLYAQQKGYFAKQGIDVTFKQGNGSQTVFASVGASGGSNTFIIDQASDLAPAISQGVPLISVAIFMPEAPDVLVAKAPAALTSPKSLEGLTVGLRSGADASLIFQKFLATNGVDASKVREVTLASSAANAALLNGTVQVVDAFTTNELPELAANTSAQLNTLAFSKWGFALPGEGVAVTKSFVQSSPRIIKRFLTAETQGIQACQQNTTACAQAIVNQEPTAIPPLPIAEKDVQATVAAEQAPAGHQLGYQTSSTWNTTLNVMPISQRLADSEYYTNSVLP